MIFTRFSSAVISVLPTAIMLLINVDYTYFFNNVIFDLTNRVPLLMLLIEPLSYRNLRKVKTRKDKTHVKKMESDQCCWIAPSKHAWSRFSLLRLCTDCYLVQEGAMSSQLHLSLFVYLPNWSDLKLLLPLKPKENSNSDRNFHNP